MDNYMKNMPIVSHHISDADTQTSLDLGNNFMSLFPPTAFVFLPNLVGVVVLRTSRAQLNLLMEHVRAHISKIHQTTPSMIVLHTGVKLCPKPEIAPEGEYVEGWLWVHPEQENRPVFQTSNDQKMDLHRLPSAVWQFREYILYARL